eukprot:4159513-Pyramimonas_sp.AAC.1
MLVAVRAAMWPHLSLSQAKAKTVFNAVADANGSEWNLGEEEDAWIDSMGRRLRTMLRHVQQATLKNMHRDIFPSACKWVRPFVEQVRELDSAPPAEDEPEVNHGIGDRVRTA